MRSYHVCVFLLLLTGCAGNKVHSPLVVSDDDPWCQRPAGKYSNFGTVSGEAETITPRLSDLLFDGELAGFEVTHIELSTDGEGKLNINSWVAEKRLLETRILDPQDKRCADGRWRIKTKWDGLVLEGVVAGLLWTGGIFLPAAQRDEYSLTLTDTGDLAVHYIGRLTGSFFFFFPMYMSDEELWFLYPKIQVKPDVQDLPD